MRRIARDQNRTQEQFVRLQKEKDELNRKRDIAALFEEASTALKDMFAKDIELLHNSSSDPYLTSVPGLIYLKVDGDLEVKVTKGKDVMAFFVLNGGTFKSFSDHKGLQKILNASSKGA